MFQLKKDVYLVNGAKRAALYDIKSSNVYSINAAAKQIIETQDQNIEFWQQLINNGIACKISKSKKNHSKLQLSSRDVKHPLDFIWFEINGDECNQKCIHCYSESSPGASKTHQRKITFKRWVKLINEAFVLGCERCQFIGGEPFLYKGENGETVLDLACIAYQTGYKYIEIFTNASLLSNSMISRIKALDLHLAISLYSIVPEIHDAVTQTSGSFFRTKKALLKIRKAGIKARVEIPLTHYNQDTVDRTIKWIKKMGFICKSPDVIRPSGRGNDHNLRPNIKSLIRYGLKVQPEFMANDETFFSNMNCNSCLCGKATITDNGNVLPCIFSRNQVMGNLKQNNLEHIIYSKQLQAVWRTTKDNVLVCCDCEYRYACNDCRPLSYTYAKETVDFLRAPYPRCTYNPYTGEWAKGVWKVSPQGEPFYNYSLTSFSESLLPNNVANFIEDNFTKGGVLNG